VLDEVAQLDFEALSRPAKGGDPTLDVNGLLQLSGGRCKNLLRYWVAQAGLAPLPGARLDEVLRQLRSRADAMPEIAFPEYSIRLYDQRLFLVRDGALRHCSGVFEFGLQPVISIDACDLNMQRAELFEQLQIEDKDQRVTLRYRADGEQNSDRHRLKRLFQQQRVPPWERDAIAQVYLDGKLSGLLR
jgi:tRNA(Ile)-lysidine synthase